MRSSWLRKKLSKGWRWATRTLIGLGLLSTACTELLREPSATHGPPQPHACEQASLAELHTLLFDAYEVLSVQRLVERPTIFRRGPLKQSHAIKQQKPQGARLLIRPKPGLTAEFLQYTARCDHFNRLTAPTKSEPRCPLELTGVSIDVVSTGSAFAIDITSSNPTTADEIVAAARKLGKNAAL